MAKPPEPITVLRLPSTALATYPRLHEIVALINHAFLTSWRTIPGLVHHDAQRYERDEQFVDDMGENGATWVAFDAKDRLIATAGYKPWDTHWKTMVRIKAQTRELEEGVKEEVGRRVEQEKQEEAKAEMERFEVVTVAVDPIVQKAGLASRLCREVDKELKEKAKEDGKKRVGVMIRAGKELLEGYWTRKGYRTVHETDFPVGVMGSKTGFTILDMERILEV